MPQPSGSSTRHSLVEIALAAKIDGRAIGDEGHRVALAGLASASNIARPLDSLRGRTVLLKTARQLPTVLALLALDGIARRVLLGLPDLEPEHLPGVVAEAGVDEVLDDSVLSSTPVAAHAPPADRPHETEWILFTSGTTGQPKMVAHTLASLTGPLDDGLAVAPGSVWSTFYDVRRYGGLQILLRALLGGGSMVLSGASESVGDFLARAGANGVTHISGTPSHWRRVLMSGEAGRMTPRYVRLSGEIADQAILDNLKAAYPAAEVAHAFASTEAGVGFDVRDGLAGFPASYIGQPGAKAELKVEDGTLRIRSSRTASRYLGDRAVLGDDAGFVDTGDMVERVGDRYYFLGRREGVINVGGQKVHPEEVEAILNSHPAVRLSLVRSRKNPITGAVVAADVVLRDPATDFTPVRAELLQACRDALPAHKVPVSLRAVASLAVAPSGKLLRPTS
jgi:acyl-coenzyme A synthetase/AMP-(fatty) acid ligase